MRLASLTLALVALLTACPTPAPDAAPDGGYFCAFDKAHVCGGPCPDGGTCQARGKTICACFPGDGG